MNFTSSYFTSSPFSSNFFSAYRTLSALIYDVHTMTVVVIATLVFVTINSLRQKTIQGLPCWPVVGMFPSVIMALRVDVYEYISEVLRRHKKTIKFKGPWFSSFNFVAVWDPRNMEYILKTKFSNFPKGVFFRETARDLLGDGIFNADGDIWLGQRKTSSIELFHSPKFGELSTSSLTELVHSRLLTYLKYSSQNSASVDLQDLLLRLTFDNVCIIAFGVDPCTLAADGLPDIPFAQAFQDATEATALRFVLPTCVWKAMRYFDLGNEKWLRKSIVIVNEFAYQVIKQRKKELSSSLFHDGSETMTKKSDLLSVFMGLLDDDEKQSGKPYSDKFLRDICVNFILAGRDSSSVVVSWFFWLIGRNPIVEERILEEISRIVGERENVNTKEVIFSAEEVKKMVYLHAALTESLRLYPALPLSFKEAVEDDVLPDGTPIEKGSKVIFLIYTMGRMREIWGEDCLEYKPERWLKDGHFVSESPYKFTAFNGGPRLCLGKDFAYFQMKFVVASILYRYRVKVVENHPVMPKLTITLYLKNGLKVDLYEREK